jgi:hypothetical protein
MTDSLSLAMMILTFFIPLVWYFGTCFASREDPEMDKEKDKEREKEKEIKDKLAQQASIHPVLKKNFAVARLVSQIPQSDLMRLL